MRYRSAALWFELASRTQSIGALDPAQVPISCRTPLYNTKADMSAIDHVLSL